MQKALAILLSCLFYVTVCSAQQANRNRTINSMTDWIEEINNWPEEVYRQYDLTVLFDMEKDQKFVSSSPNPTTLGSYAINEQVSINKKVVLYGLRFPTFGESNIVLLQRLNFKEDFLLYNLKNDRLILNNLTFNKLFQLRLVETSFFMNIINSSFKGPFVFNNPERNMTLTVAQSQLEDGLSFSSSNSGIPSLFLESSSIKGLAHIGRNSAMNSLDISASTIDNLSLEGIINNNFTIRGSNISAILMENLRPPEGNTAVSFDQIQNKLFVVENDSTNSPQKLTTDSPESFKNKQAYSRLNAQYTMLKGTYTARGDQDSYNAIYVAMKNFETKRLEYLYKENPSFDTFFTFKINQFLKVFSDYGTRPSKAIIFSMYVILAFALVYLFFPNHWDSHGKTRIVDRFSFFLKYMKRDAGMHDVYLEGKQGDILAYDEYKQLLESAGKDVPKFFQATGLPLYKWAISGTKLTAGFLSRVDVMQGTWSELPQSKRVWKSVLLISAFLIALTYDIFIKMLNALMLSINTFTTLGFGEIPIKGLPRYLAIIQGFIGWFMLTIFSVSLISQLLN